MKQDTKNTFWLTALAAVLAAMTVDSIVLMFRHPDMTETRVFLNYWYHGAIGVALIWLCVSQVRK